VVCAPWVFLMRSRYGLAAEFVAAGEALSVRRVFSRALQKILTNSLLAAHLRGRAAHGLMRMLANRVFHLRCSVARGAGASNEGLPMEGEGLFCVCLLRAAANNH
jgi:hypothetical protein